MIRARGLEKTYGSVRAVRGVDLDVGSGEVFGLVGPNGAGKTSTLKMLSGLVEPSGGEATVAGYDCQDPEMRTELGFLPEESPLYEEMTPTAYLRFFADLYDVPHGVAEDRVTGVLDRLDLDVRDRPVGDFSKGMKRKVAIARSLVNDPSVLVYDEPASGLDPITQHVVEEFTRELAAEGKTVLFSAHDLHRVESVCDRVGILVDGRLAARGTMAEIRAEFGDVEYRVTTSVPVQGSEERDGASVVVVSDMDAVEDVRERAEKAGGAVLDIRTRESDLEDVFLSVAGR